PDGEVRVNILGAVPDGESSMSSLPTILTAAQCRAGRALIDWSAEQLSQACSVDVQTIASLEARFRRPDDATLRRIRGALEEAGVVFIGENGGGAGARLRFNRREVRAINRWEGEGGKTGEDDI
ncbi:MAG: helix-turn-helix transcriptional regulator, partial [Steroidobacteraceae bacterium]